MKRFAIILGVLSILAGMIPPAALAIHWNDSQYTIGPVKQKEGRVKLRAEALKSSKVLGKYFPGTPLDVIGFSGNWAKVRIGDRVGYMMKEFICADDKWKAEEEYGEWGG